MEGVYTAVPGTGKMGWRYSSRDAVPWYQRLNARQIGAAGYWYVPQAGFWGDTEYRPTLGERAAVAVENVNDATGANRGVLGIFSTVFGLPYWLSVVLVVFVGYALLRGAGLVPSLRGVVK